jgi:hypothetical protein
MINNLTEAEISGAPGRDNAKGTGGHSQPIKQTSMHTHDRPAVVQCSAWFYETYSMCMHRLHIFRPGANKAVDLQTVRGLGNSQQVPASQISRSAHRKPHDPQFLAHTRCATSGIVLNFNLARHSDLLQIVWDTEPDEGMSIYLDWLCICKHMNEGTYRNCRLVINTGS